MHVLLTLVALAPQPLKCSPLVLRERELNVRADSVLLENYVRGRSRSFSLACSSQRTAVASLHISTTASTTASNFKTLLAPTTTDSANHGLSTCSFIFASASSQVNVCTTVRVHAFAHSIRTRIHRLEDAAASSCTSPNWNANVSSGENRTRGTVEDSLHTG